ncbi:MAG: 4-hydroxy-tetrahydrodipicolinate reductase [Alphaproteobacteria bacterium]
MEKLKLTVTGAMGRMGQALVRAIHADEGCELVGATERHEHPDIGKDVGGLILGRNLDLGLENDLRNAILGAQAIIDFTLPEASIWHGEVAAKYNIPFVVGTTGLNAEHRGKLLEYAETIPVVFAPNMSVGVNLLFHLAQRVAQVIDDDYDAEIVEKHHRNKVDAPSGTALRLAEIVAREWDREEPAEFFDHGRQGQVGVREYGRIGLHAVRGGDVIGEHDLHFLGAGEILTLSHRATSRDNFVKGALRAAHWLQKQEPGLYDMGDVLGLK